MKMVFRLPKVSIQDSKAEDTTLLLGNLAISYPHLLLWFLSYKLALLGKQNRKIAIESDDRIAYTILICCAYHR